MTCFSKNYNDFFFFFLAVLVLQNIDQKVQSSQIRYIFKLKFIDKLWSPDCLNKVLLEQSLSLFMDSLWLFLHNNNRVETLQEGL